MVSFHNVRMPVDIEQGASGGPEFKTTILELSSGFEKRNVEWSRVRPTFDVAYGIRSKTELTAIIEFFYARQGRAYGFRFKDWSDYEIDQDIGIGGGVTTEFQVLKRYTSGVTTYDRRITRLVEGTLEVYVNDILQTETTDYTVDYDTGLITFVTPPGTAATSVLTTSANPADTQTVTINGVVYTFQAALTNVSGHVKRGANETATLLNLMHAINASGGTPGVDYAASTIANPYVTATASTAHTVSIKAKVDGTAGNSYTLSDTLSGGDGFAGVLMTGGLDSTVAVVVEFDIPVRFDMDKLDIQMHWEEAMEIPNIIIVGLKE